MEPQVRYSSCSINKFDITVSNSFLDCRIFWARVVSSESESLFTKYTKHSFYEIQYALQGKIGMRLNEDDHVQIPESEFLIVPPDMCHQVVESDDCGARFIMAFSPTFRIADPQKAISALADVRPHRETAHMRSLLSIILDKDYHDEPLRRENITSLVSCFLFEVLETALAGLHADETQHKLTKTEQEVHRMLALIHDYNGIGIRVSDLAERFRFSERQLTRMFTAVTNEGPSTAIALEKMKKIEELIASTSLSFAEIAEICGFSDSYAMNKFFKRHNHVNLSEFRSISGK